MNICCHISLRDNVQLKVTYAKNSIAKKDRGQERGPDRYTRSSSPAHPEQTNRNSKRSSEHCIPQAKFGGKTRASLGLNLREISLRPFVDEGNQN